MRTEEVQVVCEGEVGLGLESVQLYASSVIGPCRVYLTIERAKVSFGPIMSNKGFPTSFEYMPAYTSILAGLVSPLLTFSLESCHQDLLCDLHTHSAKYILQLQPIALNLCVGTASAFTM